MDISLDEYIANGYCEEYENEAPKPKNNDMFKAGRRKSIDDEDADDEDIVMANVSPRSDEDFSDNWKGSVSEKALLDFELDYMQHDFESVYKQSEKEKQPSQEDLDDEPKQIFDLRSKINSKSYNNQPPRNSQQWRLMEPNINRPAGAAPLVPTFVRNKQYNNGRKRWNNKNYNANSGNQGYYKNKWGANNDLRYNQRCNNNNNNMVHRRNDNSKGDWINNVPKILENMRENPRFGNGHMPTDPVSLTPQATALRNLNSLPVDNEARNVAGMFGFDLTQTDMFPKFAAKFLEHMTAHNQTVHKPAYDMKIQKEIRTIQNKALMYNSNGAVVSADGPGVENCKIMPNNSGISLSYRFG